MLSTAQQEGCWSEEQSSSTTNSRGRETPGAVWRQMTSQDLKKVHYISLCQWGTDYYESMEVFQDKLDFYQEGCFVYEDENQIKGYLISHPWESTNIPQLNCMLYSPKQYDTYYIHDVVLLPEYRGKKIAFEIINKIISDKHCVSLLAPEPTQYYWKTYYNFTAILKCGMGLYMQRIT
jgi:GNAT superfamily N-acetyltransferase